jgi:hypothetical protein
MPTAAGAPYVQSHKPHGFSFFALTGNFPASTAFAAKQSHSVYCLLHGVMSRSW